MQHHFTIVWHVSLHEDHGNRERWIRDGAQRRLAVVFKPEGVRVEHLRDRCVRP